MLIIITNCKKETIAPQYETYADNRDDEIYKYVKIGNQFWMSENLRFTPDTGNYWSYNNSEINIYGCFYDWETANKVCPNGWHLPSDTEWTELSNYLGGPGIAGGKMKMTGTSSWAPPNKGATNSSGFSALPSGMYIGHDIFDGKGNLTYYWSSDTHLKIWWLSFNNAVLHHSLGESPHMSASVRCVRDQTTPLCSDNMDVIIFIRIKTTSIKTYLIS